MRIAAILGVMDERELLPLCLAHLYRIGVERVVALDGGSTDGSLQWLQGRRDDSLTVFPLPADVIGKPEAESALVAESARATACDWVLFLDSDEFWLPASGSLHDCVPWRDEAIEVIDVKRYNVAPRPGLHELLADLAPGRYGELPLFARALPDFRRQLEEQRQKAWIRGVPKGKIAARPDRVAGLATGWHGASGPGGRKLRRAAAADIVVAHLPFTTLSRFRRKVDNIRRLFGAHPDWCAPDAAWHWRRWAALPTAEAVEHEHARQSDSVAEMAALHAEGWLRSAAEVLESMR